MLSINMKATATFDIIPSVTHTKCILLFFLNVQKPNCKTSTYVSNVNYNKSKLNTKVYFDEIEISKAVHYTTIN